MKYALYLLGGIFTLLLGSVAYTRLTEPRITHLQKQVRELERRIRREYRRD